MKGGQQGGRPGPARRVIPGSLAAGRAACRAGSTRRWRQSTARAPPRSTAPCCSTTRWLPGVPRAACRPPALSAGCRRCVGVGVGGCVGGGGGGVVGGGEREVFGVRAAVRCGGLVVVNVWLAVRKRSLPVAAAGGMRGGGCPVELGMAGRQAALLRRSQQGAKSTTCCASRIPRCTPSSPPPPSTHTSRQQSPLKTASPRRPLRRRCWPPPRRRRSRRPPPVLRSPCRRRAPC